MIVHDNCPIHKSSIVQDWFTDHPDVVQLFWPARSPDLNPIENIWGRIVLEWDHANERNPAELELHAQKSWDRFRSSGGSDYCRNLVASMQDRVKEVIENEGKYTHY